MTHVSLHRCRFVDYTPAQITSISFSHPSTPSSPNAPPATLRAAVGRTNGSIEIWNPLGGSWLHETTLQGGKDRSIEGLAWAQDYDTLGKGGLRLFSIGYSSVVTEWDLAEGRPRVHLDCNGGVIWSIAAQPKIHSLDVTEEDNEEAKAQKIVVGTEDGTLTLLSTAGGPGQLSYVKTLMRAGTAKSRVLSLVWQDRFTVVAGMADSTIRVWDIRSGRSVSRMSLNKDKGREVLVWSVKALPNGDLVSADSRGEVCFWDGKNYALRQRIKGHEGDCLALEVGGVNGDTVISGGVDMRTVVYKHIGNARRWGQVARRRFHKHDVRAMAAYECGKFSVILSGGVDMTPIVIPLRQFGAEHHLTLPAIPQTPVVTTVPESRLMMSWWEREVKIWRIEELNSGRRGDEMYLFPGEEEERGRKLISRIMLDNEENITSAAITAVPNTSGYILAVSTIAQVKLFHLRPSKASSYSEALRVRKITLPQSLILETPGEDLDDDEETNEINITTTGARLIKFSPDSKYLTIITPSSAILLLPLLLPSQDHKPKITIASKVLSLDRQERPKPAASKQAIHNALQTPKKSKKRRIDEGTLDNYDRTITRAAFSSDSNILAVADLAGWIDTFVLAPSTGLWTRNTHGATLPKLPSAPATMEFRPPAPQSAPPNLTITANGLEELPPTTAASTEDRLLVVTARDNHILEFNVLHGRLSDWSRRNNPAEKLPLDFRIQKDRAAGLVWEVAGEKERVWVWAPTWVWMFDLKQDLPAPEGAEVAEAPAGGKRKRDVGGGKVVFLEKGESGAGDKVLAGQSRGLVTPRKPGQSVQVEEEEDGDEDMKIVLRRDSKTDDEDDEDLDAAETRRGGGWRQQAGYDAKNKPYWKTGRYRNLMAFLPVGGRESGSGRKWGGVDALEMVVVERPSWDIEMPPRFYAGGSGFASGV